MYGEEFSTFSPLNLSFQGGLRAFHQILHSAPDLTLCVEDDEDKMSGSDWKSGSGMTGNHR